MDYCTCIVGILTPLLLNGGESRAALGGGATSQRRVHEGLWYQREHRPNLIAVARPHHIAWAGETVTLDATRSWAKTGKIKRYAWTFTDGKTADGSNVKRTYTKPGSYSEILKITDADGKVDYDFAVVHREVGPFLDQ